MKQVLLDVRPTPHLSQTELAVLRVLAQHPNWTHEQVAKAISVAKVTVTMAVARMKERFGVGEMAAVVRVCVEAGMIDVESTAPRR